MTKFLSFFPQLSRRPAYTTQTEYRYYRSEIRDDCLRRCVYCDIHESEIGDGRMTLDHLRPKRHFPTLTLAPDNLVFACQECNNKKADDWPACNSANPNDFIYNDCGYIDPFTVDRNHYFEVLDDGQLKPLKHPASYMSRQLLLNRPIAKQARLRRIQIRKSIEAIQAFVEADITRTEQKIKSSTNSTEIFDGNARLANLKTMKVTVEVLMTLLELP